MADGLNDEALDVHELMQLTNKPGEGDPPNVADRANVHEQKNWNHEALTRMKWKNVSTILETVARNGGHKELEAVLSRRGRAKDVLDAFEKKVSKIYTRQMVLRDDLKAKGPIGENWQMGHVARNAARRLRDYLHAGPNASRSFKPRERGLKSSKRLHSAAHYNYNYPPMSRFEFLRLARLPGVRGLL
jgi:hypothetical protein